MKTLILITTLLLMLVSPFKIFAAADLSAKMEFIGSTNGTSLAVVVDEASLIHTSQMWPIDSKGKIVSGDATKQTEQALANLDHVLHATGASLGTVAKLNLYLASDNEQPKVQAALAKKFSGAHQPAIAFVVGDLAMPGALVALDAVAVSSIEASAVKQFHFPAKGTGGIAPAAVLPAGPKLYVSGMADTNSVVSATRKTLEKLVAAIGQMGSQRDDIVQLKVFFQPMSSFAAVQKEVADFFGGQAPPTVFVEWISPNPPVEIELIAMAHGDAKSDTNSLSFFTPPGTTDSPVFRRVARVNRGKVIYVSGLYGMNASEGAGQVREIFETLRDVTTKTGTDFEHLVKATYYVTDNPASDALNQIRPQFYNPRRAPAASKAKVKGAGMSGKTVTMDIIAVTK